MKNAILFIAISIILLTVSLPDYNGESDENGILTLFITYPDEETGIGSEVEITVHVFLDGEYFDPDYVKLELKERMIDVELTRESTGRFKGTIEIEYGDLNDYHKMDLKAEATHPGLNSDTFSISMDTVHSHFKIEMIWLSGEPGLFSPGDTVELEIRTLLHFDFIDPDEGSLKAFFYDYSVHGFNIPSYLTINRLAKGRYRTSYTVSGELDSSTTYRIGVNANYTEEIETDEGIISLKKSDGISETYSLKSYDIWVQVSNLTNDALNMRVHVNDMNGNSVADAKLSLNYHYINELYNDWKEIGSDTFESGENGFVDVNREFNDIEDLDFMLSISGEVEIGDFTQSVSLTLYRDDLIYWDYYYSDNSNYQVYPVDEVPFIKGGNAHVVNKAVFDDEVLKNQTLSVYVVSNNNIQFNEQLETDSFGKFDIEFPPPDYPEFPSYSSRSVRGFYLVNLSGSIISTFYHYKILYNDPGENTLPTSYPATSMEVEYVDQGEDMEQCALHCGARAVNPSGQAPRCPERELVSDAAH